MDCYNCSSLYNRDENCPRLLIGCGHSICEKCLRKHYFDGAIMCPECKVINEAPNINSFPKNLALLNFGNNPSLERQKHSPKRELDTEIARDPSAFCQKHGKRIEEDGYKNHEITSIENAAQKERHLINKANELTQIIEGKLRHIQEAVFDAYVTLSNAAEKSKNEITGFFNEIRKILAEREAALKQKIVDQMKAEESMLKKMENTVELRLEHVNIFYKEFQSVQLQSDIALLRNSVARIEIIKNATVNVENFEYVVPFTELNREAEMNALWKLLNPSKVQNANKGAPRPNPTTANLIASVQVNTNAVTNSNNQQPAKKLNKDSAQKNANANRNSGNLKKDQNTNHNGQFPFQFSITDKFGNKIPIGMLQQSKEKQLQEDLKRMRTNSPEKKSHAGKLTNSALEEKVAEVIGLNNYLKAEMKHRAHSPPKNEDKLQNKKGSNTPGIACAKVQKPEAKRGYANNSLVNNPYGEKAVGELEGALADMEEIAHRDLANKSDSFANDEILDLLEQGKGGSHLSSFHSRQDIPPIQDFPRKNNIRTFVTDSANKATSDISELNTQKLDLSYLCQQMTSSIYVMGGFVENSQLYIEKMDLQKGKWEIAGSFKNNRTKFATVVTPNNNILIMGGKLEGVRTASCEEYNVKDMSLTTSEITLTSAKSGFGAVIHDGELYVCGGNDGHNILRTFESYNFTTKKWTSLPYLKFKRDELAVTVGPDQKIYAIGGFGGPANLCLNVVERYDPVNKIWETIAPMNVPRRALAAVTLPDGIYAIGGFDGENYLSTVERYDEQTNEWVFVSPMNYARCTLSAVSSGDFQHIYVFGGFDNGPLKTVEKYSVINDTWESMPPLHFKRFMHASIMVSQ